MNKRGVNKRVMNKRVMNQRFLAAGAIALAACGFSMWIYRAWQKRRLYTFLSRPSAQATWPWPQARAETLGSGITHWLQLAPDGTSCDLFRVDFSANPRLKLELADEDERDENPFDNRVFYARRGLGDVARDLNTRFATPQNRAPILMVWNASYFGLKNLKPRARDWAFHNSPIVLNNRVLYNRENHRWTFGVRQHNGRAQFDMVHFANRKQLQTFEFACAGTQALLRDGIALDVRPYPRIGELPQLPPVPSTAREAGHIPTLDHMKTSRVSLAWNRDSSRLWLLVVREPDGEVPSRAAVLRARPAFGGWMLQDVQRFWLAMKNQGVSDAVALDGGDVAQLAFQKSQSYTLLPPRLAIPKGRATQRLISDRNFANAPRGGSIMNFYLRETP